MRARAKATPEDFETATLVRDYGDIAGEVAACRAAAALFDFSFLSAAWLSGPAALSTLAAITDRPLQTLAPERIAYALRNDARGRLCADLTIWNEGYGRYFVMSGRRKDILDLKAAGLASHGDCTVKDLSDRVAVLAIQGPDSLLALQGLTDSRRLAQVPYFGFADGRVGDFPCRIGRIGYSGERGFEIILPAEGQQALWQALATRTRPCGFAAADCLRIEAGYPLFANEFRLPVTAAEAGLAAFGRPIEGPARYSLVCLRGKTSKRPVLWQPPSPCPPPKPGWVTVTSACHSQFAGGALGLGYVCTEDAGLGNTVVDPSGLFDNPQIVQRPFLDPTKRRPRGPWATTNLEP